MFDFVCLMIPWCIALSFRLPTPHFFLFVPHARLGTAQEEEYEWSEQFCLI